MSSRSKVGFIGLGVMGKPMARNLLKAGYPLVVHNRSQAALDELAGVGASRAASPGEVAENADIIITMLPSSPDVGSVVEGSDGILEVVHEGHLLIDMSTINPIVSGRLGAKLGERGASMLDAPVSGGEQGAIDGILSIMVGGDAADFERALPLFEVMGRTVTHMGALGSGGFTKLANQIIVAINLTAMGEALVFGAAAGVDPRKMISALSGAWPAASVWTRRRRRFLPVISDRVSRSTCTPRIWASSTMPRPRSAFPYRRRRWSGSSSPPFGPEIGVDTTTPG